VIGWVAFAVCVLLVVAVNVLARPVRSVDDVARKGRKS
jgi:hypothetical protein